MPNPIICPYCKYKMEGFQAMSQDGPVNVDITAGMHLMCAGCTKMLIFNDDLTATVVQEDKCSPELLALIKQQRKQILTIRRMKGH